MRTLIARMYLSSTYEASVPVKCMFQDVAVTDSRRDRVADVRHVAEILQLALSQCVGCGRSNPMDPSSC